MNIKMVGKKERIVLLCEKSQNSNNIYNGIGNLNAQTTRRTRLQRYSSSLCEKMIKQKKMVTVWSEPDYII